VQSAIEEVFLGVNIPVRFLKGRHSDEGKYATFNADVTIHSLELMRIIDRALRKIEGVKLVL
jgi:putative lipoic acid-binding regulatory protein